MKAVSFKRYNDTIKFTAPEQIFISGKVIGDPDYKVKFEAATKLLEEYFKEDIFINPIVTCEVHKLTNELECLAMSCHLLKGCDAIIMLPDWKDSYGAKLEHEYAHHTKKAVFYFDQIVAQIEQLKIDQQKQEAERLKAVTEVKEELKKE